MNCSLLIWKWVIASTDVLAYGSIWDDPVWLRLTSSSLGKSSQVLVSYLALYQRKIQKKYIQGCPISVREKQKNMKLPCKTTVLLSGLCVILLHPPLFQPPSIRDKHLPFENRGQLPWINICAGSPKDSWNLRLRAKASQTSGRGGRKGWLLILAKMERLGKELLFDDRVAYNRHLCSPLHHQEMIENPWGGLLVEDPALCHGRTVTCPSVHLSVQRSLLHPAEICHVQFFSFHWIRVGSL